MPWMTKSSLVILKSHFKGCTCSFFLLGNKKRPFSFDLKCIVYYWNSTLKREYRSLLKMVSLWQLLKTQAVLSCGLCLVVVQNCVKSLVKFVPYKFQCELNNHRGRKKENWKRKPSVCPGWPNNNASPWLAQSSLAILKPHFKGYTFSFFSSWKQDASFQFRFTFPFFPFCILGK